MANAPADIKLPMFSENDDPMSNKTLLGERDNAPPTNATSAVEPPKKMWPGELYSPAFAVLQPDAS
jgi:hypothetical protein